VASAFRRKETWKPPIVKTEATRAIGIDELWRQIGRYREQSSARQASRRSERQRVRLRDLLARQLVHRVEVALPAGEIDRMAERVAARELDPYSAVSELIATVTVGRVPRRDGAVDADPASTDPANPE
jgi:LAO/AO transport system kinase